MKIERLTSAESDRFRSIRLTSLADAPDAFVTTYGEAMTWPPERWVSQVAKLPTFVAVVGGADVGVVCGAPDEKDREMAWLVSMWVAPSARGKGAGSALIDAVVAWAREGGFRSLSLEVADENQHAIDLYARKGFQPTGETNTLPPPREHIHEHRRVLRL